MPDPAEANQETGVASSTPGDIRESVVIGNIKTIGEVAAHSMGLAMQNAVASQNRMNVIAEAATSQAVKGLLETDPSEAVATNKLMTGNDLGQQIAQLAAAVAGIQQTVKAAQTTPPVTG